MADIKKARHGVHSEINSKSTQSMLKSTTLIGLEGGTKCPWTCLTCSPWPAPPSMRANWANWSDECEAQRGRLNQAGQLSVRGIAKLASGGKTYHPSIPSYCWMLLQIKSISIRKTSSINVMMLMKRRLVYMQTNECAAVVVRVDNRDDGLTRNIGKHECVFIHNPHHSHILP